MQYSPTPTVCKKEVAADIGHLPYMIFSYILNRYHVIMIIILESYIAPILYSTVHYNITDIFLP